MKTIGEHLRDCREDMDMKQKEVAKALNISNKMLSCYERDASYPSLETFKTLCEYYNASSDEILEIRLQKEEPTQVPVFLDDDQRKLLTYFDTLSPEDKDAIIGLAIVYSKEKKRRHS